MFVLGVDPGLSRCGYCIVGRTGHESRAVALGVLRTGTTLTVAQRLVGLRDEISALLEEFAPAVVAIERVLFQANARTAMSVSQASGVVMAEAAGRGCQVVEYSPNEVKEAVTGFGAADKNQVKEMVKTLLGLGHIGSPDAADAAAVALCHLARQPAQPTEVAG
ncbi:MAG: Crossover junction endodeoxyribonuclease RuvC [Acidimicrobiales bacterium]|nr:MAG: crossover junction endodeoxyribonuclease RuvC [Actinomycetota bacterium]MBV6507041.1 Crossover junction endodeoxyribonuclease RuvC [Acidimicrobiales bacterium]RIK05648.1 MAG: crossover junction endodeoxyribonuclease RuvC [Acidobacteriota bacterium]